MCSANAVNTAIDFKTITIAYSISALVVSLVLLLYLFVALFYFVKNCLKVVQCIEINCVCTILFEMLYNVHTYYSFDKIIVLGSFDCCLFFISDFFEDTCAFNLTCGYLGVTK